MKFSSVLLFLFLGTVAAFAQSAENPGHVPRPPHYAHWTIAYTVAGKSAAANEPKEAEYIVTGGTSSVHLTFGNGKTEQSYQIDTFLLTETPGSHRLLMTSLIKENGEVSTYQDVYPGFEGLTAKTYTGSVTAFGEECDHFQSEFQEGWISQKTNLPVAIKKGNVTGKYTFLDPPTEPLKLPSPYREYAEDHFGGGGSSAAQAAFSRFSP